MAALVQIQTAGGWSRRQARPARVPAAETTSWHSLDRPPPLGLPPPSTVEQPQACSISRSLHDSSRADQTAGGWLWCQALSTRGPATAETSTHTLDPPPPCIVEQRLQACSISRSLHGGSGADQPAGGWSRRQALSARVPAAQTTSTHTVDPPPPRIVD